MHIHILGICGTFMGSLALLARALGHEVTGSDAACYPPMGPQLREQGIAFEDGYDPRHLDPPPDLTLVGNALSRGNPVVEYLLDAGLPFRSGPQWLFEEVLFRRRVIAVAGTHGKTTTSSLIAWILEQAGLAPGFLIGGVPMDFGVSARLGEGPCFVVEADEYDTAFFDKRAKFMHYHPRTLVLNNLEFDHADIYPDLSSIQRQFHHLIRTVPRSGLILAPTRDKALQEVLGMGCWSKVEGLGSGGTWGARSLNPQGSRFEVIHLGRVAGEVSWKLRGIHNVRNALAALAAAHHAGVPLETALEALSRFQGVKRRLEVKGVVGGVTVYDDFAHHPTAIASTLEALRGGEGRIIAVVEPRSNTMRLGVHRHSLAPSLAEADEVVFYQPQELPWSLEEVARRLPRAWVSTEPEAIISHLASRVRPGDRVVFMSNGAFDHLHERLLEALRV